MVKPEAMSQRPVGWSSVDFNSRNPSVVLNYDQTVQWNGRTCSAELGCQCHYLAPKVQQTVYNNVVELHGEEGAYKQTIQNLERGLVRTHNNRLGLQEISLHGNPAIFGRKAVKDGVMIQVRDSKHTFSKGVLVETNQDDVTTSRDTVVQQAFNNARVTQAVLKNFGWASMDGQGMRDLNHVHVGNEYDNAYWDGSKMWYGDGDKIVFNKPFTADPDVGGHEHAHGVTQYRNHLRYKYSDGAANESWSDWYGSIVKQYYQSIQVDANGQFVVDSSGRFKLKPISQQVDVLHADWLIGDLLINDSSGAKLSLRRMDEKPAYVNHRYLGTDDQPAHRADYVQTEEDDGGVHINSKIANRAKYESAKKFAELSGDPVYLWKGNASTLSKLLWDVHGEVRSTYKNDDSAFQLEADLSWTRAVNYYGGEGSKEATAIAHGWTTVGYSVHLR